MTERGSEVEIYQDKAGEWRWRILAGNGQTMADSGEGYDSKFNCERALRRLLGLLLEEAARREAEGTNAEET